MRKTQYILAGLTLAIASAQSLAQQMTNFDGDYVLTDVHFGSSSIISLQERSTLDPFSLEELSEFRAAGVDPSWIYDRFELPSFNISTHRFTQDEHPLLIESWANHYTSESGLRINDSLSFSVGRTTELRDGDISGSEGTLDGGSGREHVSSIAQDEGEYDVYDLSLEWEAISAGPVTVSMLSGLKAIEANIGKRITTDGETTIESAHRFAAIPMVGSGIRWKINDDLSFSSAALTHPVETGETLIDFNASTDLRLSQNIGFRAGYRMIRSSFDVGSVNTQVEQEGLFARLQIKF